MGEGPGSTSPADTLTLDFQVQDCERMNFCWLSHAV